MTRRKKVIIMFAPRYEHSGSTIMRGQQLAAIIKRFYRKKLAVRYSTLSMKHRNSFIFLTKGAVTDITVKQIGDLRDKGNVVVLDPVDNPLDILKAQAANGVAAASLEAYDAYIGQGFTSFIVNHHVDTRLKRVQGTKNPIATLKCGYFGELINTIQSPKIAEYVTFTHVDTGKQSNDWLSEPSKYNLHYGLRSNNVEAFKPFLKGFTAAACNANIVIQRNQREAVRWLGEDYPYLIEPNPSEADIVNMLEYIQKDFGSAQWQKALEQMELIRHRTSDKSIANEFYSMVIAAK